MSRGGKAVLIFASILLIAALLLLRWWNNPLNQAFTRWAGGDSAERATLIVTQRDTCADAPFVLPIDGFIGLLYGDPRGPYNLMRRHQGVDIFVDVEIGTQPVYAAYAGYVSRDRDWTSTLILRVPEDPLQPDRQIWIYHTHMADEDGNDFIEPAFDRGVREVFVEQGTLLGYVGNYDGNQPSQVWPHLHVSIVKDDGKGRYLNEYYIDNTLDPSAYFGIDVGYGSAETGAAICP